MCFRERKVPAGIVGCLSVIVMLLALMMIFLSIRFNSGIGGMQMALGDNLGEGVGDYANFAFYALIIASVVALFASICGICACKKTNRCMSVCFGCTLLPATLTLLIFGILLTTVSHTSEEDFREFCAQDHVASNYDGKRVEMMKNLRRSVEDIDYTVGSLVSKTMCSNVCPCDLDDIDIEAQQEWLTLFADEELL